MATYQRKPVEVEAIQYAGQPLEDFPGWARPSFYTNVGRLFMHTSSGGGVVELGDWIVDGAEKTFTPEGFAAEYEPANAPKTD